MEIFISSRNEWREWLIINHQTEAEVWLVYYKKGSGKPRIAYKDAVEEAICFGWIDGKIKRVNEEYYIQRFTPRRPGSRWTRHNIEIARKLSEAGLMDKAGIKAYKGALENPGRIYDNRADPDPPVPEDLLAALKPNRTALSNFMNYSQSQKRNFIYWMTCTKRDDTRKRRVEKIVWYAERNIKPGMI